MFYRKRRRKIDNALARIEESYRDIYDILKEDRDLEGMLISQKKYMRELEEKLKANEESNKLNLAVVSNLLIDFWRELPELKKKYLLPEEQNNMVRDFLKSNL